MNTNTIKSADPIAHAQNVHRMLQEVITHLRADQDQVEEARYQALLETAAEVLGGLQVAFTDYCKGAEKAWKR